MKDGSYDALIAEAKAAIDAGDDISAIESAATALESANKELFGTAASYLRDAAKALSTY